MHPIDASSAPTGSEHQRVESVVQTLAGLHSDGESLAEIAHDARNMVTALGLYCDLLEDPGVLAPAFAHYGGELRLVAAASRRLVEKLVALDNPVATQPGFRRSDTSRGDAPTSYGRGSDTARNQTPGIDGRAAERWLARGASPLAANVHWDLLPSAPVANLAAEVLATRNLLSALAGPAIVLTVNAEGGAQPVRISCEELTRVLVNLVKNAVEAMPSGGRLRIVLREQAIPERQDRAESGKAAGWLALAVEDNGPGIPPDAVERIFESGYTAHAPNAGGTAKSAHRGLGLAISRSIVEAAGGRIFAENDPLGGARIVMELPVEEGVRSIGGR